MRAATGRKSPARCARHPFVKGGDSSPGRAGTNTANGKRETQNRKWKTGHLIRFLFPVFHFFAVLLETLSYP
jgi:hypothetical protein